ncbi:MAG: UDP-glucose 6-dehydrogenase [Candidatus Aenigmatarchaeota archaeon]|nr:MAG: UDP-glucose 6-dehydrogenase [Candidatus Aenigmarchaeota archaeon]
MKISVIGSGFVGLSTGVGFAKKENDVILVDNDREKVNKINDGVCPFYEPELEDELVEQLYLGKIKATDDLQYAVLNSDISFICVPTPFGKKGIDLSYIEKVSKDLGMVLKDKNAYHIVVVKSTVVPETTERIVLPLLERFSGKSFGNYFGLCVNPEFLREGSALNDFLNPDRIVIGGIDEKSIDALKRLYKNFNSPIIVTDWRTAEMIKYVSNAFLATKISFANEIGNICKKLDIDTYEVMDAVGLDHRICREFLNAGIGFGGSCFPKDLSALIVKSESLRYEPKLLKEVLEINKKQPLRMVELLKERLGDLKDKTVAVLGLSFKPNTSDIRDAPSLKIVDSLLKRGCKVKAYDPKAMDDFKKMFPNITYCRNPRDALNGSDACLILTEWDEFKSLRDTDFGVMKNRLIIEGRRVLKGVKGCEGICW